MDWQIFDKWRIEVDRSLVENKGIFYDIGDFSNMSEEEMLPSLRVLLPYHYEQASNEHELEAKFGMILWSVCFRKCWDPRDKVFGILGLAEESIRRRFTVDYTQPVASVFATAAKVGWLDKLQPTRPSRRFAVLCEMRDECLREVPGLPSVSQPTLLSYLFDPDKDSYVADVLRM